MHGTITTSAFINPYGLVLDYDMASGWRSCGKLFSKKRLKFLLWLSSCGNQTTKWIASRKLFLTTALIGISISPGGLPYQEAAHAIEQKQRHATSSLLLNNHVATLNYSLSEDVYHFHMCAFSNLLSTLYSLCLLFSLSFINQSGHPLTCTLYKCACTVCNYLVH